MEMKEMEIIIRQQNARIQELINENEDLKDQVAYLKQIIKDMDEEDDEFEDKYEDMRLGLL